MAPFFYIYSTIKNLIMAKESKGGGEKIDSKKVAAAHKIYWDVLVGKKKLSVDQLPQSCTFNLYQLKAYLTEVENEFNKLNVPYAERCVSVLPIAYEEKGKVTFALTPAVSSATGEAVHQFNQKTKSKKATKLTAGSAASYDLQLNAFNGGTDFP
jgi:hypothetical protein